MSLIVEGTVAEIYETQLVKEKYRKRDFVVATTEDVNGTPYTNYAKLQLSSIKCDLLDTYKVGDKVKVNFNLRGVKYQKEGRDAYFSYQECWKISKI